MKLIVVVLAFISITSGAVLMAPVTKPMQSEYGQLVLFKKGFFAVGLIPTFQRMKQWVSSLTLKKTKTKLKTVKKPVKIFRAPFDLIGKFSA